MKNCLSIIGMLFLAYIAIGIMLAIAMSVAAGQFNWAASAAIVAAWPVLLFFYLMFNAANPENPFLD